MPLLWLLALLILPAPAAGSVRQSGRLPVAGPVVIGRFHLLPGRSPAAGPRRDIYGPRPIRFGVRPLRGIRALRAIPFGVRPPRDVRALRWTRSGVRLGRAARPAPLVAVVVQPVSVSTLAWVGTALLLLGLSVHWAVWRALPPRGRGPQPPSPSRTGD